MSESKISICPQSCDPVFYESISTDFKAAVKQKYQLPDQFLLSVGSIIERKNLLRVCKALAEVPEKIRLPLIVIGNGGGYKKTVQQYIQTSKLEKWVVFLSDFNQDSGKVFITNEELAAIYKLSTAVIYASIFEGWGIPVLEAMASGTPVVTSNISSMPEVGGNAVLYIDPFSKKSITAAFIQLIENTSLQNSLKAKGLTQAQLFNQQNCAKSVMNVYKEILK